MKNTVQALKQQNKTKQSLHKTYNVKTDNAKNNTAAQKIKQNENQTETQNS